MRETVHDTIILEREINASITAVWNVYVDPIARAQWGVPAGEAMVIDEADFREGSQDRYRCGPPGSCSTFTSLRSTTGSFHNGRRSPAYQSCDPGFRTQQKYNVGDDHDSTCFLRWVWHDRRKP